MSEPVRVERDGGILTITLDRPKANAVDATTSRALGAAFSAFFADPELRVAILTGAGERFFSAGWDLKAAAAGEPADADYGPGGFGGLGDLPARRKPVIAAVNGLAVGGGFEMVLACDLVVAAEHATFSLPETRVGVIADNAAVRLQRLLPRPVAIEMLLAGRRMEAAEAANWGLVNAVVPPTDTLARARSLAHAIIDGAPLAVAAVHAVLEATEGLPLAEARRRVLSGSISEIDRMLRSDDAQEGPRAFAEKRPPVWRGR